MANILIISGNLPSWTKNTGGEERTATLAEALVGHCVTFLCFSWKASSEIKNINNIEFIRPAAELNSIQQHTLTVRQSAKNNHDVTKFLHKKLLKNFNDQVKKISSKSDLIILDHFSTSPFLEDIIGNVPIVYNSHNAEIIMMKQLYPNDNFVNKIIEKMERLAISSSVAMTYCSKKDFDEIKDYYQSVPNDSMYIPNGTELRDKIDYKKRIQSKNIVFLGSNHPPNNLAANKIIDVAKAVPEYNFVIVGGAGNDLDKKNLPENMTTVGFVSNVELDLFLSSSFAFINPMDFGSGTHLKMTKALSYGIPIITSAIGARGFSQTEIDNSMILAENLEDFIIAIRTLSNEKLYERLSNRGFEIAKTYDWEKIKKEYLSFINRLLGQYSINY